MIYKAKKCAYCGKEFTPISGVQIYCSKKCQALATNDNRRLKRQAKKLEEKAIANNFASVELVKENLFYRCNRKDCKSYIESDKYYYNSCKALEDITNDYVKTCPFYKNIFDK